jgi:hypothetical protein
LIYSIRISELLIAGKGEGHARHCPPSLQIWKKIKIEKRRKYTTYSYQYLKEFFEIIPCCIILRRSVNSLEQEFVSISVGYNLGYSVNIGQHPSMEFSGDKGDSFRNHRVKVIR